MKKQIFTTLTLLALIIVPNFTAFSQTKSSSIVTTDETVSFLLNENKLAKSVIEAQDKRIADLEAENAATRENSESISKSYDAAKSEITSLRLSNDALNRAVALNEQTIQLLQSDRDKWKGKAKKAGQGKWRAYAIAAAVIALEILAP